MMRKFGLKEVTVIIFIFGLPAKMKIDKESENGWY